MPNSGYEAPSKIALAPSTETSSTTTMADLYSKDIGPPSRRGDKTFLQVSPPIREKPAPSKQDLLKLYSNMLK
jgi:hypothetical protein